MTDLETADREDGRLIIDLRGEEPEVIVDIRDDPEMPFFTDLIDEEVRERFNQLGEEVSQVSDSLRLLREFDPPTALHVSRTALVAGQLAHNSGRTELEIDLVMIAAAMHDVGKIMIDLGIVNPDKEDEAVIDKSGKDDRWQQILLHPELGFRIALDMFRAEPEDSPYRKVVPLLILTHHCHNKAGRPYPSKEELRGLAVEGLLAPEDLDDPQLVELAKIIAIADVYEAITAQRKYQKGRGFEDPSVVQGVLQESHPDMPNQIAELMGLQHRRFPPAGWMKTTDAATVEYAE